MMQEREGEKAEEPLRFCLEKIVFLPMVVRGYFGIFDCRFFPVRLAQNYQEKKEKRPVFCVFINCCTEKRRCHEKCGSRFCSIIVSPFQSSNVT
jgi:hypothetical protein